MKKLLLILTIILFCSTKCDDKSDNASYTFKKTYSQIEKNKVSNDIDSLSTLYKIDHLNLDKWMTLKMDQDSGHVEQKMISRYSDTTITIIYSKYVISDSTYYELRIRQMIKPK